MNFVRYAIAVLVALSGLPAAEASSFKLELHQPTMSSDSRAFVAALDNTILASVDWGGALPSGYNASHTVAYVPARVLALLRDELAAASDPAAIAAHTWLLSELGPYGSTATDAIPPSFLVGLILVGETIETSEWCGTGRDVDKRCTGTCVSPQGVGTCAGCHCKGTATIRN